MPLVSLNEDQLQKPLGKLRKMLKKLPQSPSPEQVHDLRTRTRRVEADLQALRLDRNGRGKRLLKVLAPIRRRAGKVRDMDVLSSLAAGLHDTADEDCLVQLLEHLGAERHRKSSKLYKGVRKTRSRARKLLRTTAKVVAGTLKKSSNGSGRNAPGPADVKTESLQLEDELRSWPRLTSANLHPFRLKVKELRYVLQMERGADEDFIDSLGEMKDAIGEWHDWTELAAIAEKLLDHGPECKLMKHIRSRVRDTFSHALSLAERTRRRYLKSGPQS